MWPERLAISRPRRSTSSGTRPAAWTMSLCRTPPASCTNSAISPMGCKTPVSLLAAITETMGGPASGEANFESSRVSSLTSITPFASTPIWRTLVCSKRPPSSTEGCSMLEIKQAPSIAPGSPRPQLAGASAVMLASLPPLVKITRSAAAPANAATSRRAASIIAWARRPSACTDEGLPALSSARSTPARTSGDIGALAL